MPRWTPLSMKYCVRLKTTPARIRRRFTIASKSPVNGVSSRPRVSAGSASYGEGTSGSLSPSSPCGRGGRFSATDFEPLVPTDSRPPGADDDELGDDEQLAVRQSRPASSPYVRNEVITKSALSSFFNDRTGQARQAHCGGETGGPAALSLEGELMITT